MKLFNYLFVIYTNLCLSLVKCYQKLSNQLR